VNWFSAKAAFGLARWVWALALLSVLVISLIIVYHLITAKPKAEAKLAQSQTAAAQANGADAVGVVGAAESGIRPRTILDGVMLMTLAKLKAPMRGLTLLCATLACAACVSGGPIIATPSACSSLLPLEWKDGVPGAPCLTATRSATGRSFPTPQAGQLDKANDHYVSAVGIVARCEARDAKAITHAKRGFLGL
jgi:hypothetical protein